MKLPAREHLQKGGLALGGMVVGAFVGIAIQVGVESTGLLGPSVEALLIEQEANFQDMTDRLQSLKGQSDDPAMQKSLDELSKLLAKQGELQSQSNSEMAYLSGQIANLEQQSLDERGFAGGVDFWLKAGESVSIGDRRHVFGLNRDLGKVVDVNLNGAKSRMRVGDTASTDSCTVYFKQGVA
ncbi:MAG: hypothetical protein MO852_16900, partial [Candidatus Devosia euplotis]|nr:hypothetical protein [Candidatus Devosia euplotis]